MGRLSSLDFFLFFSIFYSDALPSELVDDSPSSSYFSPFFYLVVIGLFVGFLGGFDLFAFGLLFTGYEDWHVGVLLLVFFSLFFCSVIFFRFRGYIYLRSSASFGSLVLVAAGVGRVPTRRAGNAGVCRRRPIES
jgi:hypothetical protein